MHLRSIHRQWSQIVRNVYRCMYIQLCIYDTVIRDISSVVSASKPSRISLSLSLFHAVTICRRTRGRILNSIGWNRDKGETRKGGRVKNPRNGFQREYNASFLLDYVNHYEKRRGPFIRGRSRMRKRMQFLLPPRFSNCRPGPAYTRAKIKRCLSS